MRAQKQMSGMGKPLRRHVFSPHSVLSACAGFSLGLVPGPRKRAAPRWCPEDSCRTRRAKNRSIKNPHSPCVREHVLGFTSGSCQPLPPGAPRTPALRQGLMLALSVLPACQPNQAASDHTTHLPPPPPQEGDQLPLSVWRQFPWRPPAPLCIPAVLFFLLGLEQAMPATTPGPLHSLFLLFTQPGYPYPQGRPLRLLPVSDHLCGTSSEVVPGPPALDASPALPTVLSLPWVVFLSGT